MWVFLGMETIANIKYRSHVDSDSCLLAVCRWLIPHEVAPQQSFTMLQPANAKVIIKNGTTKNNHIYFILQFDPLKHSINNSSCNLTYTPNLHLLVESAFVHCTRHLLTSAKIQNEKPLAHFCMHLMPLWQGDKATRPLTAEPGWRRSIIARTTTRRLSTY